MGIDRPTPMSWEAVIVLSLSLLAIALVLTTFVVRVRVEPTRPDAVAAAAEPDTGWRLQRVLHSVNGYDSNVFIIHTPSGRCVLALHGNGQGAAMLLLPDCEDARE